MAATRVCSLCGKAYGPEYADTFCECGFELVKNPAGAAAELEAPLPLADMGKAGGPAAGTPCLVLYGPGKMPVRFFPLSKDVTVIGRQDPVEGCFPDIDLGMYLDEAASRKISRQHIMILHSRADDSYLLRPMAGNTGTQLENDMLPAQQEFPLRPGSRIILGASVRLKFEIA